MSCKEEKPATVEKRGFTLKPAHLAWLGILSSVPGIAQNTAAVSSLRKRVEEAPAVSAFDRWKLKLKNPLIWHVDTPLEARIAAKLLGHKNKVTERVARRALDRAVSEPTGALATAPKYPFGVIAYSRKTPEEVVKHEIGHIQDRVWESQKPGLPPLFIKKHPRYIDEVEAWDNANVSEDNPLREGALKTYEGILRSHRDMTYVGVPALLASLIMKRPIKIAEDTGTALRKSAQARGIQQIQPIVSNVVDTLGGGEDAEKMMMGITGAETRYGMHPDTYKKRSFGRGLFQFDRPGFDATKDVTSHPRLKQHYKKIKDQWGIDWNKVTYDDMYKPLHSAIGARLRLLNVPSAIPKTREGRAQYWKKHWNSYAPNAKGTPQKYLERTHPNYSMKANPAPPVAKMAENIAEKAAVIKQRSNKWVLLSKDGKKVLGTHSTKDKAMKQEQAIQISKQADSLIMLSIRRNGVEKVAVPVELIDDHPGRVKGMSKYASAPKHAMLFDIPGPFWMKGVNYPLDVAFLSKEGQVLDVQHMPVSHAPDHMKARYASNVAGAQYALELPMALSKQAKLRVGDSLAPTDEKKAQWDEPSTYVLGTGLGISGVAAKAISDLNRINQSADDWLDGGKRFSKLVGRPEHSIDDALKMLEHYSDGGHKLLNHNVLGSPMPYNLVTKANPLMSGRLKALLNAYRKDRRIPSSIGGPVHNAISGLSSQLGRLHSEALRGLEYTGLGHTSLGRATEILQRGADKAKSMADATRMMSTPTDRIMAIGKEMEGAQKHYDLFRKRNARGEQIAELFEDVMATKNPKLQGQLTGDMWKTLQNNSLDFRERFAQLLKQAPDDATRAALTNTLQDTAGDMTRRLAGYAGGGKPILKALRGVGALGLLGGGALSIGGLKGLLAARNREPGWFKEGFDWSGRRAQREQDKRVGQVSTALGALGVGRGAYTMARPLDVATNWGEYADWGAGHSTPGKVIRDMLLDEQRKGNRIRVTDTLRDKNTGKISPRQTTYMRGEAMDRLRRVLNRRFDMMFDMGMGASAPTGWFTELDTAATPKGGWWERQVSKPGLLPSLYRHMSKPTTHAGGHVSYMTDLTPNASMTSSGPGRYRTMVLPQLLREKFTPNLLRDSVITWGPNAQGRTADIAAQIPKHLREYRTSNVAPPAANMGPIRAIRDTASQGQLKARAAVTDELIGYLEDLKNTPGADPSDVAQASKNVKLLREAQAAGKKVVVISGSGRGDQVALKALKLREALDKSSAKNKIQIVALNGGARGYTPLVNSVDKLDDVVNIGRLPPHIFPKVPLIADLHWGSTGTSSLFESLATPTPFGYPESADKWKSDEVRRLGSVTADNAGKKQWVPNTPLWKRLGGITGNKTPAEALDMLNSINTDEWNKYQKLFASRQLGALPLQTADDVVRVMRRMADDPRYAHKLMEGASRRAAGVASKAESSRAALQEVIPKILRRGKMIKLIRGGGLAGLGLGALGYGASRLNRAES